MKYQIFAQILDPFDLTCSDCEVHVIEYYEDISLEELREVYNTDPDRDNMTFNEWLVDCESVDFIRSM